MTSRTGGRVARTIAVLCCAAELSLTALFVVYSLVIADANHTGLPLAWAPMAAVATGLASALSLGARERGLLSRRVALCLLLSSMVMFLAVEGFERLNVMMEYETWARKGMPPKP